MHHCCMILGIALVRTINFSSNDHGLVDREFTSTMEYKTMTNHEFSAQNESVQSQKINLIQACSDTDWSQVFKKSDAQKKIDDFEIVDIQPSNKTPEQRPDSKTVPSEAPGPQNFPKEPGSDPSKRVPFDHLPGTRFEQKPIIREGGELKLPNQADKEQAERDAFNKKLEAVAKFANVSDKDTQMFVRVANDLLDGNVDDLEKALKDATPEQMKTLAELLNKFGIKAKYFGLTNEIDLELVERPYVPDGTMDAITLKTYNLTLTTKGLTGAELTWEGGISGRGRTALAVGDAAKQFGKAMKGANLSRVAPAPAPIDWN